MNKAQKIFIHFLLVLTLVSSCSQRGREASKKISDTTKPRVILMHDIGGDPDDEQSLIRFLVYANEIDIEAITMVDLVRAFVDSTQQEWTRNRHDEIIAGYAEAYPNLIKHADGYPTVEELNEVTYMGNYGLRFAGRPGYPENFWDWVGDGETPLGDPKDSPASNAIVAALEKDDSRPLYVMMWGGAYTLVQALWRYEQRNPGVDYSDRLIFYSILWQDMAYDYFRNLEEIGFHYGRTFQGTYDGVRNIKPTIIDNAHFDWWYKNNGSPLGDYEQNQFTKEWADEHIRSHGLLGANYPEAGHLLGVREGDSPAIFHLLSAIKGLNEVQDPSMGGWGGRFVLAEELGPQYYVDDVFGTSQLSKESFKDSLDGFNHIAMTSARWRNDIQNDFQARMDWVITNDYDSANHNPIAILNGDASSEIVRLKVKPGERVILDASQSSDPDGDDLSYEWFQYLEAGTYAGLLIQGTLTDKRVQITIPKGFEDGQEAHIILKVKDNGTPNLVDYKRVVISW